MKNAIKKAISILFIAVMVFGTTPLAGFMGIDLYEINLFSTKAEAATHSGSCGDNLTWTLDTTIGELIISGEGDMYDESYDYSAPWADYRSSIKSVTIGNSVTSIGDCAFENCDSLTSVTIGNSVKSIGFDAFYSCERLESITIPDSVTSIDERSFYSCIRLTSISVGSGNEAFSIDEYGVLFNKYKTKLIQYPTGNKRTHYIIPDSVTSIGGYAFAHALLTSVTIPNSVTSIGRNAFWNCNRFTSITIPNSVTSIGRGAFAVCQRLANINVGSENKAFSIDEYGVLFNKDKTELIQYPIGNGRTSYIIPDSVTSIGDCAFENCDSLTSVTIPNSVTSIGIYTFDKCDSLTDVYYTGTEEEWSAISTGRDNDALIGATIHFNFCSIFDYDIDFPGHEFKNGYLTIAEGEALTAQIKLKYDLCEKAYVDRTSSDSPYWVSYTIHTEDGEDTFKSGGITINGFDTSPLVSGKEYEVTLFITATEDLPSGKYSIDISFPGTGCDTHEKYGDYSGTIKLGITDEDCCTFIRDNESVTYEMYNGYLMIPQNDICVFDQTLTYDLCSHGSVECNPELESFVNFEMRKKGNKELMFSGFGIVNQEDGGAVVSDKEYKLSLVIPTEDLEPGEYELVFHYPGVSCDVHEFSFSESSYYNIKIIENGTLSFDANGGNGAPDSMTGAVYYTIPQTVPEREGYVFAGWSPSGSSNDIIKSGDKYGIFRGTTLYAVWEDDDKPVVSVPELVPQPSVSQISYGDSIVLHVDVSSIPKGGYVEWTASNGNFDYNISPDGTTCTISPNKSGDTTFTATIFDAQGNAVSTDEQVMTSKAGFFDKIIAFFKKLFGLTKVIPQAFKGIY